MIIGIIVNLRQLNYIRNTNLGFNPDQIITFGTPGVTGTDQYSQRETLKERLKKYPDIKNLSYTSGMTGVGSGSGGGALYKIDGINKRIPFKLIDEDYLDVMGIKVVDGRGFSKDAPGDRTPLIAMGSTETYSTVKYTLGILINQTAVREFGFKSPLGKIIYWEDGPREWACRVIGVVKDFHSKSLHDKIEPLVLSWTPPMGMANVKISGANIPATLKNIRKEFENVYGQASFNYSFLDENIDRQYKSDEQIAVVIGYFTILAVIIACLGLFSLSSFMVSRRTKEIGIRKTLGASMARIYFLLAWDFLKWIILAVIIAAPVAWYLMNHWLQSFAYHIELGPDIFLIAALVTTIIALSTVTWQSLKTALANPVEALRYE